VIFISFVGSWMYGMGNDSSCLMLEMQGGASLNNFSVLVWFSFFMVSCSLCFSCFSLSFFYGFWLDGYLLFGASGVKWDPFFLYELLSFFFMKRVCNVPFVRWVCYHDKHTDIR